MTISRRNFLKSGMALGLGASTLGLLSTKPAAAANIDDYKALVCVFLDGGLDSHDMILPQDVASYDQLVAARASLLNLHGDSRARASLLTLDADNNNDFGTRRFGLAPEMPGMQSLFNQGKAALIGNVGPLVEPTTAAAFNNRSVALPPHLFSHNDQQNIWQANSPEGAFSGWGGLFGDIMQAAGANSEPVFTSITTSVNPVFANGISTQPFSISGEASTTIGLLDQYTNSPTIREALAQHYRAGTFAGNNLIARDLAAKHTTAYDSNTRYSSVQAGATPLNTAFPDSPLGGQLNNIAKAVSVRNILGARRQIFFVNIGGFDTHSRQAVNLPELLSQIDGAVSAFYNSMTELGVADKVTLFTASDFGRALIPNGDGTDHGWGAHHFVVGDAVRGKQIYGELPPPVVGHEQDGGIGRLVPTHSVEQYAATMGQWFGLNQNELGSVLPNLGNFASRDLGFMG